MDFLIGTLARAGGEGIVRVRLEKGKLRRLWTDATLKDPIWLSRGPDGRIFSVSRDFDGEMTGCVNELRVRENGISVMRREATGGSDPCHLEHSEDGRHLFCANYTSGSLAVFPVDGQAGLLPRIQLIQHQGCGPNPERQRSPHIHQVTSIPHLPGRFCVCDLGTDKLVVYEQNRKTGLLTKVYDIPLPPGEGPRHVAYGRGGHAWLATELGCHLYSVALEKDGGAVGACVSTTIDAPPVEGNTAAAVRVSADGSKIFVSNRGEGSILCVDSDRRRIAGWKTSGAIPRDFVPVDNQLILVACQDEGLCLLKDGELVDTLPVMGAVCVLGM